jgi:hypothetical protein
MYDMLNIINKMSIISFVYKWTNKIDGRYYIGRHTGTLDDGYISSSYVLNPLVEQELLLPESQRQWQRDILSKGSSEQMAIAEILQLKKHKAVDDLLCLNQTNGSGKIVFKDSVDVKPKYRIKDILEQI